MLSLSATYSIRWSGKYASVHLCNYDRVTQTLGVQRSLSWASVSAGSSSTVFYLSGAAVMTLASGGVTVNRVSNRAPSPSTSRLEIVRNWDRKQVIATVDASGTLYTLNYYEGTALPSGTDQMVLSGVSFSPIGVTTGGVVVPVGDVITDADGNALTDADGNPLFFVQ